MSVSRPQTRLLLSVVALAAIAGLFVPAIELLRDLQLLPGGSLQLNIVLVVSALAPCVAVGVGRRTGASRPVTVLLATAAAALASSLISPYPGALWGLLASTVFVYPESRTTRLLLRALRWVVVFGIGVAGVSLSRRVAIDGGSYWAASSLVFSIAILLQLFVLRATGIGRRWSAFAGSQSDVRLVTASSLGASDDIRTTNSQAAARAKPCDERGLRSRLTVLAASGAGLLLLLSVPLSWKVGWDVEMNRRIRVVMEKGGDVRLDRSKLLAAVWKSVAEFDLQFQAVSGLPYDPKMWTVDSDWVRDLRWGAPARSVTLCDASGPDIRTLRKLYGIRKLVIMGSRVDDAMLSELPMLEEVTDLTIKSTNVRGDFLSRSDLLRKVLSVRIEQSPFTDAGLKLLDQRLSANQYWNSQRGGLYLIGTQVTPQGLEPVFRHPIWPVWLEADSLDAPLLIKTLRHPDARARSWAADRVAKMDPLTATPALIEALDDPSEVALSSVVRGLRSIGSAATTSEGLFQEIKRALELTAQEDGYRGYSAHRPLSRMLRSRMDVVDAREVATSPESTEYSKLAALQKLRESGGGEAFTREVILAGIALAKTTENSRLRANVFRQLDGVTDPVLENLLLDALTSDPDEWVRYWAARTLAHYRSSLRVSEALSKAMDWDASSDVRSVARRSLGEH